MDIILISPTDFDAHEAAVYQAAIDMGFYAIHLRKPNKDEIDIKKYLDDLSPDILKQSILHYYDEVVTDYDIKGLHLSSLQAQITLIEKQDIILNKDKIVSTSFHSPKEVETLGEHFSYAFCSPVFPSLSKKSYLPEFEWETNNLDAKCDLFALGGIKPNRVEKAKKKGFQGVATLGYIWQKETLKDKIKSLQKIKDLCDSLS